MIEQEKIRGQLARLKAELAAANSETASLLAKSPRDDMALRRASAREKRLADEIKALESRLIPDIIA